MFPRQSDRYETGMIMRFGNSRVESQRDSGSKPRVARNELPWERWAKAHNPNGVVAGPRNPDTTPLGLKTALATTQGSSFLATLGWKTQSLWDCGQLSQLRLRHPAVFQSFRTAFLQVSISERHDHHEQQP